MTGYALKAHVRPGRRPPFGGPTASEYQELASGDQELASGGQELASEDQELASEDQESASGDYSSRGTESTRTQ